MVLSLLLGCVPSVVPHRIFDRRVTLSQTVHLSGLAPDSSVIRVDDHGAILATHLTGDADLSFEYDATEHVDNAVASRTPIPTHVHLVVQAPGYIPAPLDLVLPVESASVEMVSPAIAFVDVPVDMEPEIDRALELAAAGRCADAQEVVRQQASLASSRSILDLVHRCTDVGLVETTSTAKFVDLGVDPELAASPRKLVEKLRAAYERGHDHAGQAGLDRLLADVSSGRLNEAARISALLAAPLRADLAALTVRLPEALLADARMRHAASAAVSGDMRAAVELALEARHLDPLRSPTAFAKLMNMRARELRDRGLAAEADGDVLLAHAYLMAAQEIAHTESDRQQIAADLEQTGARARDEIEIHLAFVTAGDRDVIARLRQKLRARLPAYVQLEDDAKHADAMLSFSCGQPARTYTFRKDYRSMEVVIGTVTRPNPDYDPAREAVNAAVDRVNQAVDDYNNLHSAAVGLANQQTSSSAVTIANAVGAAAEETTARKILGDARNDLAQAKRDLARTPRTISEKVTRNARYPVVHIDETATTHVAYRLEGFGDVLDGSEDISARMAADAIEADDTLGIEGVSPDVSALTSSSPDVDASLQTIANTIDGRIRSYLSSESSKAFVAARGTSDVEAAAIRAAIYLDVSEQPSDRADVLEFLIRSLR